MSYVDCREPGGTEVHPTSWPARSMYCLFVIQDMNFHAASLRGEVSGMARDQEYNQPDDGVATTGAGAYPICPATVDSAGSSTVPAADVASYHMAAWPWPNCVAHSEKPACDAPGSPCWRTRST